MLEDHNGKIDGIAAATDDNNEETDAAINLDNFNKEMDSWKRDKSQY